MNRVRNRDVLRGAALIRARAVMQILKALTFLRPLLYDGELAYCYLGEA